MSEQHAGRATFVTRDRIIASGRTLFLNSGFSGVGLKQLLESCGVPKGSFYHYFPSKQAFGCAVLQDYVTDYLERFDALTASPGPAGERLNRFFSAWHQADPENSIAERCLIVKLASEVADLSEDMRLILDDGVQALLARLAGLIAEGVADGSVASGIDPEFAARSLYAQWLGAALLAKLSKSRAPLGDAMTETRHRLGLGNLIATGG